MITKETDHAPHTETLGGERNSFLGFIDENKDVFEQHSALTYELRDEDAGWRNSSTAAQLVQEYIDLVMSSLPSSGISSKRLNRASRELRRYAVRMLFMHPDEGDTFLERHKHNLLPAMRRVKDQRLNGFDELCERLDEFNRDFHQAKAPIAAEVQESKAQLSSKFSDYLLSDPNNLLAFRDFLSDKRYAPNREAIRPFFANFTQNGDQSAKDGKGDILGEAVKKWAGEISEKATPDILILNEFAKSIKAVNIREWLEFAAKGKDIASYLFTHSDFSSWPSELRKTFKSFVQSKYQSAHGVIKQELDQFRRPSTLKGPAQQYEFLEEETGTAAPAAAEKKPDNQETLEKTERLKYPVGNLIKEIGSSFEIRVLTDEELTGRLQKEADYLAPNDQRMMADLERMFSSLRNDPYGLGTEKFPAHAVGVDNRRISLRSFNSLKRIGLQHDHPDSHHIRIVYVICRNNAGSIIGLEGIYRHDDYLKKFT